MNGRKNEWAQKMGERSFALIVWFMALVLNVAGKLLGRSLRSCVELHRADLDGN
jgi:hypothetical protein